MSAIQPDPAPADTALGVIEDYVRAVHAIDLDPDHHVVLEKNGTRVRLEYGPTGDRFDVLNFSSNDVFGFSQHPAVITAAVEAIQRFGTSNSSCATLSGRIDLHRQLEDEIGAFKGLGHTYLFLNAWMALQALFDGFCHLAIPAPGFRNTRETFVLTDILNHGCITSAVVNAGNRSGKMFSHSPAVRVKSYRHGDPANLASKLERFARDGDRIVVVTDAVFSMDGDIAPLPQILDVLARYPGSVLVLDEAHSSGALGPTGGGICEHFGISPRDIQARGIDPIILTTFSKFAASAGAAISTACAPLIELLDVCPTSIGTISLPPAQAAAALAAIRQLRAQPELSGSLRDKTALLRRILTDRGFELLGETNVVPIVLPDGLMPKHVSRHLLERHRIWVSPVWFIAKPRLRVVVTATHTEQDLRLLADSLIDSIGALTERNRA